jgi:hypothetical protein
MSSATCMLAALAANVSLSVEHTWSIDTMRTPIWRSALQGRRDVEHLNIAEINKPARWVTMPIAASSGSARSSPTTTPRGDLPTHSS